MSKPSAKCTNCKYFESPRCLTRNINIEHPRNTVCLNFSITTRAVVWQIIAKDPQHINPTTAKKLATKIFSLLEDPRLYKNPAVEKELLTLIKKLEEKQLAVIYHRLKKTGGYEWAEGYGQFSTIIPNTPIPTNNLPLPPILNQVYELSNLSPPIYTLTGSLVHEQRKNPQILGELLVTTQPSSKQQSIPVIPYYKEKRPVVEKNIVPFHCGFCGKLGSTYVETVNSKSEVVRFCSSLHYLKWWETERLKSQIIFEKEIEGETEDEEFIDQLGGEEEEEGEEVEEEQ